MTHEVQLRNVYKGRNGKKFVVHKGNIGDIKANPDNYEFVCERPHQDGSFAYYCGEDWCRCGQ